jgi:hypothetical protein
VSERLDRLEALAETILLAIQQQQTQITEVREQQDRDRQEFRENLRESVDDVVSMIATLANNMSEMQSEVRGLQAENRRILDQLLNNRGN